MQSLRIWLNLGRMEGLIQELLKTKWVGFVILPLGVRLLCCFLSLLFFFFLPQIPQNQLKISIKINRLTPSYIYIYIYFTRVKTGPVLVYIPSFKSFGETGANQSLLVSKDQPIMQTAQLLLQIPLNPLF